MKTKKVAINESSQWKCKVKEEKENNEIVYKVYEIFDNLWVATFHNKKHAELFANAYPKLKERYLNQNKTTESKKQEKTIIENELDKKIEEALKEIYK